MLKAFCIKLGEEKGTVAKGPKKVKPARKLHRERKKGNIRREKENTK